MPLLYTITLFRNSIPLCCGGCLVILGKLPQTHTHCLSPARVRLPTNLQPVPLFCPCGTCTASFRLRVRSYTSSIQLSVASEHFREIPSCWSDPESQTRDVPRRRGAGAVVLGGGFFGSVATRGSCRVPRLAIAPSIRSSRSDSESLLGREPNSDIEPNSPTDVGL